MTLGENIWAQSIVEWHKLDEPTVIALGRIVIAAIDASFADVRQDFESEMMAIEESTGTSRRAGFEAGVRAACAALTSIWGADLVTTQAACDKLLQRRQT